MVSRVQEGRDSRQGEAATGAMRALDLRTRPSSDLVIALEDRSRRRYRCRGLSGQQHFPPEMLGARPGGGHLVLRSGDGEHPAAPALLLGSQGGDEKEEQHVRGGVDSLSNTTDGGKLGRLKNLRLIKVVRLDTQGTPGAPTSTTGGSTRWSEYLTRSPFYYGQGDLFEAPAGVTAQVPSPIFQGEDRKDADRGESTTGAPALDPGLGKDHNRRHLFATEGRLWRRWRQPRPAGSEPLPLLEPAGSWLDAPQLSVDAASSLLASATLVSEHSCGSAAARPSAAAAATQPDADPAPPSAPQAQNNDAAAAHVALQLSLVGQRIRHSGALQAADRRSLTASLVHAMCAALRLAAPSGVASAAEEVEFHVSGAVQALLRLAVAPGGAAEELRGFVGDLGGIQLDVLQLGCS